MVFCASLPPWPSEKSAAETNCSLRKVASAKAGEAFTKDHETISTRSSARPKPSAGETTMPATVLPTPDQITGLKPALAMPAPSRPPISAWDDDDGMPASQVMMFQVMAPPSAPKITASETMLASMIPLPTVAATCWPKNRKAIKLKKAAQNTAYLAGSTRVETMVAMELAAS